MTQGINLELRYGSAKHTKILAAIMSRYTLGDEARDKKLADFTTSEELYRAYVKETDEDAARRVNRENGVPEFTTLEIPYSYAILLAAHTYWTTIFLSRSPVMQFMGRHSETEANTQALEALIDYQISVGNAMPVYYNWFHDTPKYGHGIIWQWWDEEIITTSEIAYEPETVFGLPIPGGKKKRVKKARTTRGYMGNRQFNVRPHDFLFDPRVSMLNFQQGEFVGRDVDTSWNDLVVGQANGMYFNIDIVKMKKLSGKKGQSDEGSHLTDLPGEEISVSELELSNVGFVPLIEMVITLIPKDWGLGRGELPEKWVFTVADKSVIIQARPQGAHHNKYPVHILQYEFDAYSIYPRSMMEILKPLNDTLTWLVNTHFYNVRAALNNMFVFDPQQIVSKDLTRKGAGKLIRLREGLMPGQRDVRAAIMQLQVADVTGTHLQDTRIIGDLIQRVSGVADSIMGMLAPGGRKSATEVRQSNSFGINRLKTTAEYWGEMGFKPHAQMLVQNTQQYYDMEQLFRVAGDLVEGIPDRILVKPEDIQGFYDFTPVDGTMPIDRYAQANLWREILMGVQRMPQIAARYNLGGIFEWMAQLSGLKNIRQFRVQVVPDAQAMAQAQAGNIVPLGGQGGGARTVPSGSSGRDEGRVAGVSEPGQIPGMGQTG